MNIKEIPEVVLKHFNTDITTAKVLTIILNWIKKGMETDAKMQAVDEFWEVHKNEFHDMGFICSSTIEHPLFGAYNRISTRLRYLRMEKMQNPFVITSHKYKDFDSTGPLSMDQICNESLCTLKDVKISLNKLQSLGIIGKGTKDFMSTYWYWLEDESYLVAIK
jgi:hypothetical protein